MNAIASLRLIFRFSQAFGLLPFGLEKSNGALAFVESNKRLVYIKILSCVFAIVEVLLVLYEGLVNLDSVPKQSAKTVLLLSALSCSLSGYMVFRTILKQRNQFCFWLNRIADVFSNLKEEHLGKVVRFYYRVTLLTTTIMAGSIVIVFYMSVFLKWNHHESVTLSYASNVFIVFYNVLVFEIKMFVQLFVMFVNLLYFYYEEVQGVLKGEKKRGEGREFWVRYTRELRVKDSDVKDLLDFLHCFFLPVISLQLFWVFVTMLFYVAAVINFSIPAIVQLTWLTFIFWDVGILVVVCHKTEKQSHRTVHALHELLIHWDDKELKREANLLSLQLLHRKFEFTAMGCQKINFSLIYSMAGTLTSYAVILMQSHTE